MVGSATLALGVGQVGKGGFSKRLEADLGRNVFSMQSPQPSEGKEEQVPSVTQQVAGIDLVGTVLHLENPETRELTKSFLHETYILVWAHWQ